ncbi:MAG: glycogen synthase [Verrucomicrobia bacterium]|nr:glycogen synthase [Verrucomicrobiota bacterium]
MKILMATSEFSPLGSTGDLGDQVRILAIELKKLGHDVSVVMPFYRSVREGKYATRPTKDEFQVNLGGKRASSDVLETTSPEGIQVYLVRRDEYFDRSGIYGGDGRNYDDNAERFIFFSKAVVELAGRILPSPEVIHCHDWTTALTPVFARDRQMPIRTVLTIHNLEYQGSFWSFDFGLTGLPGSYFGPKGLEFYGRMNFLKSGILYADAVTLPGEPALFEAFTPQHGFGLDSVLQENRFHLHGIPHGVDYAQTNPPSQELVGRPQQSGATNGKSSCRRALLEKLELEQNPNGMVLYLPIESTDEEAFGYLKPILDLILTADTCLVVTGEGSDEDLAAFIVAERKYPARFAHLPNPGPTLPVLGLAGADVILLPSSLGFHGENAIAAMRYGTLPIVKARKGVHQIVSDYDPAKESGCGFVYNDHFPMALWDSIRRANQLYRQPEEWKKLMQRAEALDFSWTQSAKAFVRLYANLLRHQEAAQA